MSFYQNVAKVGTKFFSLKTLLKYGFNWSPMYRRTTAKVVEVSDDISFVKIRIPYSYKNRNYANTIFGGSMFAAVDPIPMVQLVNLLDENYIVWDRSAEIKFKRPAKEALFAQFTYSEEEIASIKQQVREQNEINIEKITYLTNADQSQTFCEVKKVIYIADKAFYKEKIAKRATKK